MSRLAKTSKFRHTAATPGRIDKCYSDLKVNNLIWDCSNLLDANMKYIAFAWQSAGGGKICVAEHGKPGKITKPCLLTGHTSQVIDWKFHPFNQSLMATGSDDCTVKIWQIPETLPEAGISEAMVTHTGHSKKVGVLQWHPSAEHLLATASMDHTVKLWDVENGERGSIACHKEQISSVNWNLEGNLINTTSKDKKLRIIDARTGEVVSEVGSHDGSKTQRSIWAKRRNQIVTVGFSKTLERQIKVWDPKNMSEPLHTEDVDNQSGVLFPFFDEDTSILYFQGKGDGSLRSYELWDEAIPLTELDCVPSSVPAKGCCFLPKQALDVRNCEIARAMKIENNMVVPISFKLPRKTAATEFQEDVFPDTFKKEPAVTAKEWFSGTNAEPKTESVKPYWEGDVEQAAHSGELKMSSAKLVSAEDIAAAEKKIAEAEEALNKAKAELEELKAKQAEQQA